jgi:hypothetical protein
MDKLTHYRKLIKQSMCDYVALANRSPTEGLASYLLFDEEHDHYMVFRVGWWKRERVSSATLFVRLANGKIWIEEDWTEAGLATDLVEAGVPNEDIVLAFHHPEMRALSEFAMA